jgi:hypothetical protein
MMARGSIVGFGLTFLLNHIATGSPPAKASWHASWILILFRVNTQIVPEPLRCFSQESTPFTTPLANHHPRVCPTYAPPRLTQRPSLPSKPAFQDSIRCSAFMSRGPRRDVVHILGHPRSLVYTHLHNYKPDNELFQMNHKYLPPCQLAILIPARVRSLTSTNTTYKGHDE